MHILISQQILLESVFIWRIIHIDVMINVTVPVNVQSKAWVCGPSLAGIAGTNPAGPRMSVYCERSVLSVRGLCVELITRPESPTDCGVSECDREASKMRRFWPTRGCCAITSIINVFRSSLKGRLFYSM